MYPQEARLRSLTYSVPIYIDISCDQYAIDADRKYNPDDQPVKHRKIPYEFLGYLPMMLRTKYCILHGKKDRDLTYVGECTFDQGGYFIINGSEKVWNNPMNYIYDDDDVNYVDMMMMMMMII